MSQTVRKVFKGVQVPAKEKFVSIFEAHADIIIKNKRETFYEHIICLTAGVSNFFLACKILDGNPAGFSLTGKMISIFEDCLTKVYS